MVLLRVLMRSSRDVAMGGLLVVGPKAPQMFASAPGVR